MTIDQIQEKLAPFKPASKRQVIRYLNACKVKPMGIRQRPQQYPANAVDKIMMRLGLVYGVKKAVLKFNAQVRGLPSMSELRATRQKARAAK